MADIESEIRRLIESKGYLSFVQIGANDGVRGDNLNTLLGPYSFDQVHGVLVEPNKPVFRELLAKRGANENLVFINKAVHWCHGTLKMYQNPDEWDGGNWSEGKGNWGSHGSFTPWFEPDEECYVEVDCCSFADLLRDYGIGDIDLLYVDTEGYDGEVIKMMAVARVTPAVIVYEHKHVRDDESVRALLTSLGYSLTVINDFDTLCVLKDPEECAAG